MLTMLDLLARDQQSEESGRGLSCGLPTIDEATGGLTPGHFWVLTAAPGQGRTALLTQFAARMALDHSWRTYLLCPQEPEAYVTARLLAVRAGLPLHHLVQGKIEDDDPRILKARSALADAPLCVAPRGHTHPLSTSEVEQSPPDALVVDDAHLIAGATSARLKRLANAGAFVAVTLPKHLVVDVDDQGPVLQAEWASVADVVIEIRQATWPADPHSLRAGEAHLSILRNRRGPTFTASVIFYAHQARFRNLER